MKLLSLYLTLVLTIALAGCSRPEPPPRPEVARPAKIFTVEGPEAMMIRSFPGEVRASDVAELAFRVGGEIVEFPANRGLQAKQGQLLARLDPADYQATVNQAQAQYNLAVAQFDRAADLIGRQLISQAEYDQRQALMKVRKADLTRAQNNLDYTQMFAPFDGVVARRLAENFESVAPGQVVLVMQTQQMIDVIVDVPESIIARVERTRINQEPTPVQVRFGSTTERTYEAFYKEHETDADPATLTFRVTFSLPVPQDINVLPGMSATVIADLSELFEEDMQGMTLVPIEAVFSFEEDPLDAEFRSVWVVNPDTMRTSRRAVRVGDPTGGKIAILEGLATNEQIVAAGVNAVQEGMLVRPMQRERGL
ncbi:MAG: efflux RND transporter periplasmic adaptor subunit [Xanthomonadales bacterium]|nr:efflux RND transporter periplasmic adaptor subunit [Xanthomonadales bacterium]NNK34046.1 efflux RND transporter periplasmic adaptor subunit [Xanthomonadales bacterium]